MKSLSTAAAAISLACLATATHQAAAFPAPGAALDRPAADIVHVKKKTTEPAPKPKAGTNRPPIKFDGVQGETINKDHDRWHTWGAARRR